MKSRLAPRLSEPHDLFTFRRTAAVSAVLMASLCVPALAQDAPGASDPPPPPVESPRAAPNPRYQVSEFTIEYFAVEGDVETPQKLQRVAPLAEMLDLSVELADDNGVFMAPAVAGASDPNTYRFRISAMPAGEYDLSAINLMCTRILRHLNDRELIGVRVVPANIDVNTGADLRTEQERGMTLVIVVGVVDELRTLAEGPRVPRERRMNSTREVAQGGGWRNEEHRWVIERSPVQVGDLLDQRKLEDYIFRLSRHPGRRVDMAMSSSELEPGGAGVVVDYLISENKPWVVYGQISNTGTEQTSELRERFGFIHNQLTNNDDILSVDYITANFDDAHAVLGSYERPLDRERLWRGRVFGSWSEYTASDVGFAGENFTGKSWSAGGEVSFNVYQNRELFIDLLGGARWENIQVNNEAVLIEGEGDFLVPYIGGRLERVTDVSNSYATVMLEFAYTGVSGTDEDDLTRLGRFAPDEDWILLRWDGIHSFYLEPLLDDNWRDPNAPGSKLAHEIQVTLKGQYAFENRLIPQAEQVVGGLYTVRGYDESIVAGDTVIIGSLEYRLHVPKVFPVRQDPYRPERNTLANSIFGDEFRFAPTQAFGGTDWDLILKAFVDAGQAFISDAFVFEDDHTLVSAGIGFEFVFRRNLSVRVDWGVVLNDIEFTDVEAGDNRVHFVATFLF